MSVKISIIIPVYNAEVFLKQCLDSAVSQTIKEKEILCVDDGSSDGSYSVLEEYQRHYSFIRVFRQMNKGSGVARNLALKKAVGKYVCFLDADDFYLDPNALEKMVFTCEKNQLRACSGLMQLYQDGLYENQFLYRDYFDDGRNAGGVLVIFKEQPNDYYYHNYIFDLNFIKRNKILFPPYRRYQDPPFLLRFMVLAKKYMILPIEFYAYRFSEEALVRKTTYIEDTLKGIRDNIKIAQEHHLYELGNILIGRICSEYVRGIINCANQEVLQLMQEIQKILFEENDEANFAKVQVESFDNVLTLLTISIKNINIGKYFEKKGITTLAIYGMGNYGSIIIEEIGKSKAITLYGIDQKIQKKPGIKIDTLENVNKVCTNIIVTPIKDNEEIVNNIKKKWDGTVWGLNKLLHQILEEQSRIFKDM